MASVRTIHTTGNGNPGDFKEKSDASLLVLLVDATPSSWPVASAQDRSVKIEAGSTPTPQSRPSSLSFSAMAEHVMVFLNAYALLHRSNQLAVIGYHPAKSAFLFPKVERGSRSSQELAEDKQGSTNTDDSIDIGHMNMTLADSLQSFADLFLPSTDAAGPLFAGALSLALCYVNRVKRAYPDLNARILVLQSSHDVPAQYVSVMNCIFTAQKLAVLVDACVLATEDSLFLQQASHLTGGTYHKSSQHSELLQYLMTLFLPDTLSRQYICLPPHGVVDYRATCFCHQKVVQAGVVCPVCLSIFCKPMPICRTCGARFPEVSRQLRPKRAAKQNSV